MRRLFRDLPDRFLLPCLLTAAALLLEPAQGLAQFGIGMWNAPKLSSSDLVIIRKLARHDLTGKPNGTALPWSNPDSGNSGTVTLVNSFPSQGRECRRVRYLIKPGPQQASFAQTTTYVLTNCRLADGTWKIDQDAQPDASGQ